MFVNGEVYWSFRKSLSSRSFSDSEDDLKSVERNRSALKFVEKKKDKDGDKFVRTIDIHHKGLEAEAPYKILSQALRHGTLASNIQTSEGFIMIAIPAFLIGWNMYKFDFIKKKTPKKNVDLDKNTGDDIMEAIATNPSMTKIARLRLILRRNPTKLSVELTSKGISSKLRSKILNIVADSLQSQINMATQLYLSRKQLLENQRKEIENYQAKTKKLELDKIINPDKYRTKSSTVKRVNSNGSCRYVPSSSMRSRGEIIQRKGG
jgi:hypothetical protein